jgi:hypothetical protein
MLAFAPIPPDQSMDMHYAPQVFPSFNNLASHFSWAKGAPARVSRSGSHCSCEHVDRCLGQEHRVALVP